MSQARARCQLASALLVALFLFPAAARAEQKAGIVVVTSATAEIKRSTTVLGTVKQGQRFRMSEIQGDWYRIHFQRNGKDVDGWIHRNDVRVEPAQGKSAPQLTAEQVKRLSDKNVAELLSRFRKLNQAGRSREAAAVARLLVTICREVLGEQHSITATWLNNLGSMLQAAGDYVAARKSYERSLNITRKVRGEQHPETASSLNSLGVLLEATGDYTAARKSYEQALAIWQKVFGDEHPDTAAALNNLGHLLQATGDYTAARSYLEQALTIQKKVLGDEHSQTATSLNNLGNVLYQTGDYGAARMYYEQALAIRKKVHGEQHPDTAISLNSLGDLLYNAAGDYAGARTYYEQALAIRQNSLGEQHPDTALSLNSLGQLCGGMGDYTTARTYFEQALAIYRNVLGEKHPSAASSMNNLGNLSQTTGDYTAARTYFEQALAIYRNALGDEHASTATALSNLGLLLKTTGDYAAARPHLEQALEFYRKVLGEQHPSTATALNNLGSLLEYTGDYSAAKLYYEQALAIKKRVLGNEHSDTAGSLNNLGLLLQKMGDYTAARQYFEQALAIHRKVFGDQHPSTVLSLNNLAVLLQRTGDATGAVVCFDEARHGIRRHVARVLPGLSPAEQLTFLTNTDEAQLHAALSLGRLNRDDTAIAALSAGWLVNGKAVAHEALAQRTLLARESTDPAAAAVLRELESVRSQLARQSLKAVAPDQQKVHRQQLAELEAAADRLTRRLGQLGINAAQPDPWVELDDVRSRIPAGGVLIDIVRFRPFDFDAGRREQAARYTAWIIPAAGAGEIRIVDLGEADAVEAAVKTARTALEQSATLIRMQGEPEAEQALRQPLEELSKLVLQPLLAETGDAKQLILSPDAQLWLVPWSALPIGDEKYAVEDYELSFVVSGRDLVTKRKPLQSQPPLILADPAFGPARQTQGTGQRNGSSLAHLPSVPQLPGTAAEARAIQPRIKQYSGQAPTLKTGDDATEAAFRTVRRPQVLTLSTHGFFLPDQEVKQTDERLALSSETRSVALTTDGKPLENPLLRCGLLLAGCNTRSTAAADADDGVLTGLEIVGTDLRGTQLVVLSACETGLGDVRNGEGVAGLRQAFQLAGAESIVATLWQVPDSDTARLMVDFFGQLADGKSRSDALRNAQLARIRSHRERYGAAHPFFWAAVTLTGRRD